MKTVHLKMMVAPLVVLGLLTGILTGLVRTGLSIPMGKVAVEHGGAMLGSFLGTVIILERVVTFKSKWLYLFPIANGLSLLFFFVGLPTIAAYLLVVGSMGLVFIYFLIIFRHSEKYFYVMLMGAVSWLIGNVMLIRTNMYPFASSWWMAFILLTVFGERLELSKFLPTSRQKNVLLAIALIIYVGSLFVPFHKYGQSINAIGLLFIAFWLLKYDMIRISIRGKGLHKFTGSNLLFGYLWLIAAAISIIWFAEKPMNYDAVLHMFFLGFTFSMIIAHGPIILPGVLKLPFKPFSSTLYFWSALLQISVVLRIYADLAEQLHIRPFSGILSAIAILGYVVNLVFITKTHKAL